MQVKADIETKGTFIDGLIEKVMGAAYNDIEEVLKFVDWLDGELSSLVIFIFSTCFEVIGRQQRVYHIQLRFRLQIPLFQLTYSPVILG